MSQPSQAEQNPAPAFRPWLTRRRAIRIARAVATGLGLAVVICLVSALQAHMARRLYVGLDGLRPLLLAALAAVVGTGVLILKCRPRLRTIAAVAAGGMAIGLIADSLFRIEGFYGNLIPRLAWRWTPTAEQRFADYEESRERSNEPRTQEPPPVKLSPSEHDYPGFLGSTRDGVVRGVKLDRDWETRPPRELWRHAVGLGWSSFAVVGDFAVTQEQRGPHETIVCYDVRTGRECWTHADAVRFSASQGDGPRATPSIAGGRVYAMGATGLLTCLDGATGRLIWQQYVLANLGRGSPSQSNLLWGMAGSPLIVDGWVIVSPGGPDRSVLAFYAGDGTLAWSGGDDPGAYASPMLVSFDDVHQILSFNGAGLRGIDATNGHPLWLHPWVTQGEQMVNVAQPILVVPPVAASEPPASDAGFVLISSGYGVGAALVRVTRKGGMWQAAEVWRNKNLKSKFSNFVVRGGYVYGLDDGILVCLDVRDGRRLWKQGRYGHGQILLVDDLLLIQAEHGNVVLVEATPAGHHELASLQALSDKTWNNPVLAGRILLIRNSSEAAAYELPGLD